MAFKKLRRRAAESELMDDFTSGGTELTEALRHLRKLNWIFGAAGPTLYGVNYLWRKSGKPGQLTVLDIGCGSGDVNRRLLRWADRNGIRLHIVLADITEEACEEARLIFRNEKRVEVIRGDLFRLRESCADIVTATQVAHHFSPERLPDLVSRMLSASRLGIVINDIHRHYTAWLAVWLTTRLLSRNRYIRHDGPLSVAKGFRAADWESLKEAANAPDLAYSWRPLFRYAVTALKQ